MQLLKEERTIAAAHLKVPDLKTILHRCESGLLPTVLVCLITAQIDVLILNVNRHVARTDTAQLKSALCDNITSRRPGIAAQQQDMMLEWEIDEFVPIDAVFLPVEIAANPFIELFVAELNGSTIFGAHRISELSGIVE